MAKQAINYGQLTGSELNSGRPLRVSFSYGVFSIATKVTQSGAYLYVHKRVRGKLHKVYLGKLGDVTKNDLHKATMGLRAKYDLGAGRDNRGRR